jgi:hypothetical protein
MSTTALHGEATHTSCPPPPRATPPLSPKTHLVDHGRRRRFDPSIPHAVLDRGEAQPPLPPAVLRVEGRHVRCPLLELAQRLGALPHAPEGLGVFHHLPVGGAVPILCCVQEWGWCGCGKGGSVHATHSKEGRRDPSTHRAAPAPLSLSLPFPFPFLLFSSLSHLVEVGLLHRHERHAQLPDLCMCVCVWTGWAEGG